MLKGLVDRVTIILLDSAGIGELPDAAKFGDIGSNTFGNIAKKFENGFFSDSRLNLLFQIFRLNSKFFSLDYCHKKKNLNF